MAAAVSAARLAGPRLRLGPGRRTRPGGTAISGRCGRCPRARRRYRTEWNVSAMVLAASEDKTVRGGFVASPGRPWAWANTLQVLAVYHAVWSRDLYEIATGLLAVGDKAAANRAIDLPVDGAAETRWLVPAELAARRHAGVRRPAAGRGGVPDRAGPSARSHWRRRLGARQARGRLHRRQRAEHAAGAVGERRRLLTGDDCGRDRGPRHGR